YRLIVMIYDNITTSSSSGSSPTGQFSDDQILQLDHIVYVTSALGCVGSLFIILSFSIFKEARSFATTLIFYLSISDLMSALSYLPFGRTSNALCNAQGAGLLFFLTSSYLWTMCISISLFMVFFLNRYELGHLLKWFHLVCWGVPSVTTLISLIAGAFGQFGSWCFIADPTSTIRLFYYLPLVFVFFVNLFVFICIRLKISQHSNSIVSRVNIIVSFYLVAFALSQLPTVINSIQTFSDPKHPLFPLFVFQLLLQPLQGFFNCIVYGVNEGFIMHYIEFFEKHICRCRKSREMKEIDVDQERLLVDYDNSDEESAPLGIDNELIIDDYSI
ncbi:hypothetical protein SAMD00019534_022570, partial [Acytostelium subglobosum LB1]|uniref:hypothetical protein n=1 Tax=Acytostelium subglobosum LB1 TaxID=1410327 RepID=UPI00064506DF